MNTSNLDVYVEAKVDRKFDLSPEKVFDAWINPELATKWLFTSENSDPVGRVVEMDLRVGGKYIICDRRDGIDIKGDGEYIEVERPSRLKFTFRIAQFSPNIDPIEIVIKPGDSGCELTAVQTIHLTHDSNHDETVRKTIEESFVIETIKGWNQMFDLLASRIN